MPGGRARCAAEGVRVEFVRADLEGMRLEGGYHLVVNVNFLVRPLIGEAVASLVPGGLFLLETILDAPGLAGVHTARFLLGRGELHRLLAPLPGSILLLEELPDEECPVARALFRKNEAG